MRNALSQKLENHTFFRMKTFLHLPISGTVWKGVKGIPYVFVDSEYSVCYTELDGANSAEYCAS
jgi:hypothetical protein